MPLRQLLRGTLAAAVLVAPAAGAQAVSPSLPLVRTLPNGLTVVVAENHAVPLATVEVVLRGGAITQQPDEQGVPHLFEHMLFRSYHLAGARWFSDAAARISAEYNGETDHESVAYHATVPAASAEAAVGLIAGLVMKPHFRDSELQTERNVVFGEFNRMVSDPRGQLRHAMERTLWGDSFYRKNTIGDEPSLRGVTVKRLGAIYRRDYLPSRAAVVVSGDVTPALVLAEVEKRFGEWAPQPDAAPATPVSALAPFDRTRIVILNGDVNDVTIMMMWRGPRVLADSIDGYAADVVSDILDDPDSRFQRRLVDSGLFSNVGIGYRSLVNVGPITLVATTTKAKLDMALTVLEAELEDMGKEGYFTAADLEYAAKRRVVDMAMQLETAEGTAATLSDWWAVTGLDYYFGYPANLAARTPAELRAYANRYIVGHPFVIGALTPTADAGLVDRYLRQFVDFTSAPR